MIFLIHYNRSTRDLVSVSEFANRKQAAAARSELEVELLECDGLREIVLLEAGTLDELKKTHSRYFSSLDELTRKRGDSAPQG